jgi:GNAT superfamily N-acetyltransferase
MLREAKPKDVPHILLLIKELATYEREPKAVKNNEIELAKDLFVEKRCHAFVWEDKSAGIVGFALYFFGYSTWKGKTVYLEDLYLKPEFRRFGIGEKLFDAVVAVAKKEKVRRMDWQVLDWNTTAIKFYEKKGAILDPTWINGRFFLE